MADVNNTQDVLDSRDVIARIDELSDELDGGAIDDETSTFMVDGVDCDEEHEELEALKALAEEASGSPDWQYGETLIRDSYFTEYAEELANDIGAVDANAQWPMSFIDWDAAAEALKQDYMSVDFDGVEYWIRA